MRNRRSVRRQQFKTGISISSLVQAGDSWFTADSYNVDGVSGKVASFVDQNDATHLLAQGNTALQSAVSSTDSALAGKLSTKFTASGGYVSNRAASAWSHIHSGAGFTGVLVGVASSVTGTNGIYGTRGATGEGLQVYGSSATVRSGLYTAAGNPIADGLDGSLALNASFVHITANATAGSPQFSQRVGAAGTPRTGSYAVAVDSTAPDSSLTLGSLGAVFAGTFNFRHLFLFKRYLTVAEQNLLLAFILADCGAS